MTAIPGRRLDPAYDQWLIDRIASWDADTFTSGKHWQLATATRGILTAADVQQAITSLHLRGYHPWAILVGAWGVTEVDIDKDDLGVPATIGKVTGRYVIVLAGHDWDTAPFDESVVIHG